MNYRDAFFISLGGFLVSIVITTLVIIDENVYDVTEAMGQPVIPFNNATIGLSDPSDRFFNFSKHQYPTFNVWWELENWNDNKNHVITIEKIEFTISENDKSIFNETKSEVRIKGIEVFDEVLLLDSAESQSILFSDSHKINRFSNTSVYEWDVNTSYLIQGDTSYVDWDLEMVVTKERNHPIILLKIYFNDSEESLQKLLEIETINVMVEVTLRNYEDSGKWKGYISLVDSVNFVFFDKEKPDDYVKRYYERRST